MNTERRPPTTEGDIARLYNQFHRKRVDDAHTFDLQFGTTEDSNWPAGSLPKMQVPYQKAEDEEEEDERFHDWSSEFALPNTARAMIRHGYELGHAGLTVERRNEIAPVNPDFGHQPPIGNRRRGWGKPEAVIAMPPKANELVLKTQHKLLDVMTKLKAQRKLKTKETPEEVHDLLWDALDQAHRLGWNARKLDKT